MIKNINIILLILFFMPGLLLAQDSTFTLEGVAVDYHSYKPLADVAITVTPDSSNPDYETQKAVTNEKGRYSINKLRPGKYNIKARLSGYLAYRNAINFDSTAVVNSSFEMVKGWAKRSYHSDFKMTFHKNEYELGLVGGIDFWKKDIFLATFFYGRPYEKKVLVREAENFYYQFKEKRFTVGLSLEKRFWFNKDWKLFLSAGVGYTFGDYSGAARKAESGLIPVANVGIFWKFFGAGYQYMEIPNVDNHRLYIALSI